MKIISLQAENVKRLSAIEIRPDGNLVQITGRNGQGKTSVLDSIFWALAGAESIQAMPIKRDATVARIRLDLGEIKVTRTFRKKPDGLTTSIMVEGADGARYGSPQKMLDALLGALSFDPLAFARMKPREQLDALRRFVPGVDFDGIENQNRGDFDRRTEVNRLARQERAAAQAIAVPEDTPAERIDEAALVAELSAAGEHNTTRERKRLNRENVAADIARLRAVHEGQQARFTTFAEERMHAAKLRIAELERLIESTRMAAEEEVKERSRQIAVEALNAKDEADLLQQKLDAAGELPEPKDLTAIQGRISAARMLNGNVALLEHRTKHANRAEQLEQQAQALTDAMDARKRAKEQAIAAAKIPIEGLGFAEDHVTLNGVPFEQGSDAEQLRASVAIAMAMNPKLRVVRIRDGSLLDEQSLKLIAEMADAHECQVWLEKVDSSGAIGFVIEDGRLKNAQPSAPEASQSQAL